MKTATYMALALLALCIPGRAEACSCQRNPVMESDLVRASDLSFDGVMTKVEHLQDLLNHTGQYAATIRITRVRKGNIKVGQEITVLTLDSEGLCGLAAWNGYTRPEPWRINAKLRSGGKAWTDLCMGNRPIDLK